MKTSPATAFPPPATAPPPPSPALPAGKNPWLIAAALVAAVLAVYANTLGVPFVYDDIEAIVENRSIRALWPLSAVLVPDLPGGITVSGRPLLNLSFAVNYAISGGAGWSYHALNVLIHAGAALTLFGLARRLLPKAIPAPAGTVDTLAAAIAFLWALHPLQTQAVTYAVQRAESLTGLFYLFTLYAFVRATETPQRGGRWRALSVIACTLGMATKETMATAPVLALLCDRTFFAGSWRAMWRERRGLHLALAATWLLLGLLVWSTGGNRGGTVGLGVGQPLWAYPLTQFQAFAYYLRLAVWPHPLVFEYGTFWVERAGDILPFSAVVLPLGFATVWALMKRPAAGFLGAWFFVILAPTSLAPGTIQMIVEHRMYLPLAAVVSGFVVLLHRWCGARAAALCAAAAVACAGATLVRNHDYRSALALWETTVQHRQGNPRAQEGLAEAYAAAGRLDDAIARHRESVRLLPDEAHYHYNLAHALARAHRTDEAIRSYRQALRLAPQEAKTHNNLALALVRSGQTDAALSHYVEARRLRPDEPLYAYNHGLALLRLGQTANSVAAFGSALRLNPDYADAHFNLGAAFTTLGRSTDALRHYGAALHLVPTDTDYRVAYAGALQLSGRSIEALAEYTAVITQHANHAAALFGRGNALAALRRTDEAMASYEAALRLKPDYADAHFKLGNTLIGTGRVQEALAHYEAAVRLAPDDAEAHHNLGIAYARLDRLPEARGAIETALRLRPNYPDAQRSLAQVRALLGR